MATIADFLAKYFAFQLTKLSASDSMQKLVSTLVDAQVDLNPHQMVAELFAFRLQLSMAATLADEFGLAKKIETGVGLEKNYAVWCHDGMRALIGTGYVNFNL